MFRVSLSTANQISHYTCFLGDVVVHAGCFVSFHAAGSKAEDSSKYGRNCSETMTLRKEGEVKKPCVHSASPRSVFNSVFSTDMHIYGYCPAHDEIYLVVCSHCGEVVKPQAFEKHCERRHGPLTKMCGQSSTLAPQQRPRPGLPLSNVSSSRERQKDGRCQEASGPSSAALPVRQHRPNKAQKETVRYLLIMFASENSTIMTYGSIQLLRVYV